jgi:hypothetical protein
LKYCASTLLDMLKALRKMAHCMAFGFSSCSKPLEICDKNDSSVNASLSTTLCFAPKALYAIILSKVESLRSSVLPILKQD